MKYCIKSSDGTVLFYYKTKKMEEGYKDSIHCYDEMKFVRIKSGCGIWNIGDKKYTVSAGDVLIMSRTDIRTVSKIIQAPFVIEQIRFLPAFLSSFNNITDFFVKRDSSFSNLLPDDIRIKDKFTEITDEVNGNMVFKDQSIKAKLSELVILTARLIDYTNSQVSKHKRMDTILKSMEYIKENYSDDLSLESVSSKFYLSTSYFSKLFKQCTGMAFNEYVASIRVNAVIQLLSANHINVLNAAMQCGFSSASGFYKTFRHVTGHTPSTYK